MKTLDPARTEQELETAETTQEAPPEARRTGGRVLADYVARTADLGWKEGTTPPLDHEAVIVAFEEEGVVRFARTRYVRAAGGWAERRLRGARFWWIHDPPL